ncbi:MAG: sortase [bacterium]|nr:sortase [bacterium]
MINKHKNCSSWLCACVSLAFSLLIWTAIASTYALQLLPESEHSAAPQLFEGVIQNIGIGMVDLTGNLLDPPLQLLHQTSPLEQESNSGGTGGNEMVDWGITQKYTLSIPAISMRAPVLLPSRRFWDARLWSMLEKQMQVGLRSGVVAYPHSPAPGINGSLIIAGHSSPPDALAAESEFSKVFARLPELQVGDKISVSYKGKAIKYEVTDSIVVSPTHTDILKQQSEEGILKLITCFPIGTTKDRMIVTAKQI